MSSLDISKACGPDLINPRLLKCASNELCAPITKLFNKLLQESMFPNCWKDANVIPLYKKGDPSDVKNYRPISLCSILGKVFEKCILKYLNIFLSENNIITNLQSGFRTGDSTICQLIDISNDIVKALDSGKEVRVFFCDISKAFDRVWHTGLLVKLRAIGISGKLLLWFENYLSNRRNRVTITNGTSEWLNINAGVPQGSILGPILFLIYINDIVLDINS